MPLTGVSSGTWGQDVLSGGGAGFEICTVAGSCKAGALSGLGGALNGPSDVATDSAGNVYVVQLVSNRVQKFDSDGNWGRAWGKNVNGGGVAEVCTVAASCQVGTSVGLGGKLNFPAGIATDSVGNVYVADQFNNRIQKFDSAGTWERAWGKNVAGGGVFGICASAASYLAGTGGALGGEFVNPNGLDTDAAGKLYVADGFNNRVQRFGDPVASTPTAAAPDNTFTIGKLKGKKLKVTVPGPGVIEVRDSREPPGRATDGLAEALSLGPVIAAKKLGLKPSETAADGAGTIKVKLKLTKTAKKKLKKKDKVKVKAAVTFTPTGGTANTETDRLKVKTKKKKK